MTIVNQDINSLEKTVELSQDQKEKADALVELGLIEFYRASFENAVKLFGEAQKIYLEIKDIASVTLCITEIALSIYKNNNGRLLRALTLLNDANYLIENKKDEEFLVIKARILHYYGIINYCERHYSEALKFYKNAIEHLPEESEELARVYDNLAIFYLRTGNYQIAYQYLEKSILIKQNYGNKRELSTTQLLLGRYYFAVEDSQQAIGALQEAANTTIFYNDKLTTARILDGLAKIFITKNNLEQAREYCFKGIELLNEYQNSLAFAFLNCTKANILINENEPQEAIEVIANVANPIFDEKEFKRGLAFSRFVAAQAYYSMTDYDEAIETLHQAIDFYRACKLNAEIAKCYYELGHIYSEVKNNKMAISSLLEALRITRINEIPVLSKKIEDYLYEIDVDEWSSVVNKSLNKEEILSEDKTFLQTLDLVSYISGKTATTSKDPLLSLLRIGRAIAAENELDVLLEIIAEETKNALGADRCTVFLLDADKNELWSKVALGMGSQEIRFPANMGLAGHVVITGDSINIKDAYNDDRFNKEIDKKTGYNTKTILCMPIRNINHEIIGVFQVLNKQGNQAFSDEDEDLLIAIGSSAGIALENARLFKEQQLMFEEQKKSFDSFVNTLAASIDARDKITSGHSSRVRLYAILIAQKMGLSEEIIGVLEYASSLHDIGKIGIKDSVLCKEGRLTPEEYKHIQQHAQITHDILGKMYFAEKYKDVPIIASSHHEKYDGSGYFKGLKGEEIPLGGRILSVSDVFDAITSKRHYRDRMDFDKVLNILKGDSGTHFDPAVVEIFFNIELDKILNVILDAYEKNLPENEVEYFKNYRISQLYDTYRTEENERSDEQKTLLWKFEDFYLLRFFQE